MNKKMIFTPILVAILGIIISLWVWYFVPNESALKLWMAKDNYDGCVFAIVFPGVLLSIFGLGWCLWMAISSKMTNKKRHPGY